MHHPRRNENSIACSLRAVLCLMIACLPLAPGLAQSRNGLNRAVLITGVQTNYGDVVQEQAPFGPFDGRIDALCNASGTIGWAMNTIIDKIERSMHNVGAPISFQRIEAIPGAPSRNEISESVRLARDRFCNQQPRPPQVEPFTIAYAYCRMAMVTPNQVMDIHLPPGVGTGTMSAADFSRNEAMRVTLSRSFDAAATVTGSGWSSQVNMSEPADGGVRIGYPTTRYRFTYSAGLGNDGMVPFAGRVSTQTSGTVWVSDAVPGFDIVRSFYENLSREVSADQAANSFFSGLLNNLVGMLEHGLPLEIDQTVASNIRGASTVSGRSHSIVTDIRVVDFTPEWCSQSLLPPNMPVRDLDSEISAAMASANSPEMAQAMKEYEQAMSQLTPEERQMMEQLGMGNMQQMMAGANAAAPQAAAPQAATPAAASGNASGSNMPPSQDLNQGSLTERVQRHLQALGYDVGAVNGEASLATTIAISTFQAEKGMEVTGEVSPQLLGVLSAEVDKRR